MEKLKMTRFLWLAFIITFLGFLDTHLLIPVIALYAKALGAAVGIVGLIVGIYSIINTPANILFGHLIDRYGFKFPLFFGLLADALAMFLYSIVKAPFQLAIVRAFHGTGGGLVGPATMTFMGWASKVTQRGRAMGLYGMAIGLSLLIAYPSSGVIVTKWGYNVLFYIGALLVFFSALLTLLLPKEKPKVEKIEFKVVANLFKKKGLLASYSSIFAFYFSFGAGVALLPLYLEALKFTPAHVGILLFFFTLIFFSFQFPLGILSDRVGRYPPIIIGLFLSAISLSLIPFLKTFPLLAGAMALYGLGFAFLFPSISALLIDTTSPEERGVATGVFHALLTTGVAIGAPIMGGVAALTSIESALFLAFLFPAFCGLLVWTIKR